MIINATRDAKESGGTYAIDRGHRTIRRGAFTFGTPIRLHLPAGIYAIRLATVFSTTVHRHVRVVAGSTQTFSVRVS
jgi:hypothetical protein